MQQLTRFQSNLHALAQHADCLGHAELAARYRTVLEQDLNGELKREPPKRHVLTEQERADMIAGFERVAL